MPHCQPQGFTFYILMGKVRRVVTTTDLVRLTGLTPARICQLAKIPGGIPATRANPGRKWRKSWYWTAQLDAWCESKAAESAARRAVPPPGTRFTFSRDFPFLNDFWKWDQAVRNEQMPPSPVERLRHEFEPMLAAIIKLCDGLDWVWREP